MVVNNTVKNEGCARDIISICSVQSFVKDERGELNFGKHSKVVVEHDAEIVIKAGTHDIIRNKNGKIVERRVSKAKGNDELVH